MSDMLRAFIILLVGMGMTIFGMTMIWLAMVWMDRIFSKKKEKTDARASIITSKYNGKGKILAAAAAVASALAKPGAKQAASAAVAVLLATRQRVKDGLESQSAAISYWLVSHRLEQINLRKQIYNRKSRGD